MDSWQNIGLYLATVMGGVGLFLMMPQRAAALRGVGVLLGLGFLGLLWGVLGTKVSGLWGEAPASFYYHYVFGLIALVSGVRVITHTQPVRAALWFIMVVLSSAGLLLTLSAEFVAYALVIVYGGAILVTYMFVLMLASQSSESESEDASPMYDRRAREPMLAVLAGFVLLSTLLGFSFESSRLPEPAVTRSLEASPLVNRVDDRLPEVVVEHRGEAGVETNLEAVGRDLFESHPLAIELAGVILLVSLVGAVVIARTEVPDDEAAGAEA